MLLLLLLLLPDPSKGWGAWRKTIEPQNPGNFPRPGSRRLVGAAETSKELAEWRQSRLCQKEKEQSRQSKAKDREGGESQGEREPHLGEKEGDQSESMKKRDVVSTVKEGGSNEETEGKQEEPS